MPERVDSGRPHSRLRPSGSSAPKAVRAAADPPRQPALVRELVSPVRCLSLDEQGKQLVGLSRIHAPDQFADQIPYQRKGVQSTGSFARHACIHRPCRCGFAAGALNAVAGGGTFLTFPALVWDRGASGRGERDGDGHGGSRLCRRRLGLPARNPRGRRALYPHDGAALRCRRPRGSFPAHGDIGRGLCRGRPVAAPDCHAAFRPGAARPAAPRGRWPRTRGLHGDHRRHLDLRRLFQTGASESSCWRRSASRALPISMP